MKDKLIYVALLVLVNIYERVIVLPTTDELGKYRSIKNMTEQAQKLVDDYDPKYVALGVRIARANYKALAKMYNASC